MDQATPGRLPDSNFRTTVVAGLGAALAFLLMQFLLGDLNTGQFGSEILDADSYTRLLRVESLLTEHRWYDNTLAWSDAPDGGEIHWTRPLDLAIIVLATPFRLVMSLRPAITLAGYLVPVLFGMASVAAIASVASSYLGVRAALLGFLGGLQPTLPLVFRWSYVDHHALQLFLFTAGLATVLVFLARPPNEAGSNAARIAGLCAGVALWVSVESQAWIFGLASIVAFIWVLDATSSIPRFLSTMSGTAAITSIVALTIERPPSDWLTVETDRLSVAQVALVVAVAIGWRVVSTLATHPLIDSFVRRFGWALAASALPAAIVVAMFPRLLKSPVDGVDPHLITILFENNGEFTRFDPHNLLYLGQLAGSTGPALFGIVYCAVVLSRSRPRRSTQNDLFAQAAVHLGLMAIFIPLALYQWRWTTYVNIVSILPWAFALRAVWKTGRDSTPTRRVLAVLFACTLVFVHLVAAVGFSAASLRGTRAESRSAASGSNPVDSVSLPPPGPIVPCTYAGLGPFFEGLTGREAKHITVMTTMYDGPQFVWETGARVVGTPYHRNQEGILDTGLAMTQQDLDMARRVISRREVDFVVICSTGNSVHVLIRSAPKSLGAIMARGEAPAWLHQVELPHSIDPSVVVLSTATRE